MLFLYYVGTGTVMLLEYLDDADSFATHQLQSLH